MPDNQIILEFLADTEGLKAAAKEMTTLNTIAKEQLEIFRKLNQENDARIKAAIKSEQDFAKVLKQTTGEAKALSEQFKQMAANIAGEVMKQYIGQIADMAKEMKDAAEETAALRAKIKELEAEIGNMGKGAGEIEELKKEIEGLKKQLGDLTVKAKEAAKINLGEALVNGLAGASVILSELQGDMEIFGLKSEGVHSALNKVNDVLTVVKETQEVYSALQKESALLSELNAAKTIAYGAALRVVDVISKVTGLSMAASWALATAGISVLITAVGVLVGSLMSYKVAGEEAARAQKELNENLNTAIDFFKDRNELIEKSGELAVQAIDKEIVKAKERKAMTVELRDLERQRDLARLESANKLYLANQKLVDGLSTEEGRTAALDELTAKEKKYAELKLNTHAMYVKNAKGEIVLREDELKNEEDAINNQKALLSIGLNILKEKDNAYKQYHENETKRVEDGKREALEAEVAKTKAAVELSTVGGAARLKAETDLANAEANLQRQALVRDAAYYENLQRIEKETWTKIAGLRLAYAEKLAQQGYNAEVAGQKAIIASTSELSKENLDAKLQLVDIEAGAEIAARTKGLTDQKQILEIGNEIEKETLKKRADLQIAYFEKIKQIRSTEIDNEAAHQRAKANLELNATGAGPQQIFNARLKQFDEEDDRLTKQQALKKEIYEAERKTLVAEHQEGTDAIRALDAEYKASVIKSDDEIAANKQEKQKAQFAYYDQLEALRKKDADAELAHQAAINNLVQNDPKSTYAQKKAAAETFNQFRLEQDQKEIDAENAKYQTEVSLLIASHADTEQLTKEHNKRMAELQDKQRADKKEAEKQDAEDEKAIISAVEEFAIESARKITDSIFANQAELRQRELNDRIQKLEEAKNHELENENLTASQKKAINKKYHDEEAALKLQAWKADQKAKAEQAIINGLLGAAMAIAQNPPPSPVGIIGAALAIAAAGVDAALILSKTPPKFEKGGKNIPAGMKLVGEKGPELLWTPGGETVIPHGDTAKILEAWSIPMPKAPAGITAGLRMHGSYALEIDYNKMSRAIAEELRNNPALNVRIDKGGISIHIMDKLKKIEVLNQRYDG